MQSFLTRDGPLATQPRTTRCTATSPWVYAHRRSLFAFVTKARGAWRGRVGKPARPEAGAACGCIAAVFVVRSVVYGVPLALLIRIRGRF